MAFIQDNLYITVTVFFILLFKRIFKNKLSAKWHLLIWILLLLRLTVPSLPQSRMSVFNIFNAPEEYTYIQNEPAESIGSENMTVVYKHEANTAVIQRELRQLIETTVVTVRACGTVLMILYFGAVYLFYMRKLKKNTSESEELSALLEDCRRMLGIKRKVGILYGAEAPMLFGILKPVIIIPEGYSHSEKKNIILHELCHLKHGDIYLILLAVIILSFYWFNPLIWYAFFVFRRDIEVYCDECVLGYCDSKKAYAELLLKTALSKNRFIAGTTSFENGEKEVAGRIKYMAYFKKPGVIWSAVAVAAAVIISAMCLTDSSDDCYMSEEKYREYINRPIGAVMANIDYADGEKVVFHYLDGLFVYNIETGEQEKRFDISRLECALPQQGSSGLEIIVSEDGKKALLLNYGPENEIKDYKNYIINLDSGKVSVTRKNNIENRVKNIKDTFEVLPGTEGWFSDNCIISDRAYYLTAGNPADIRNIQLIIADIRGNIQMREYPFRPELTAYADDIVSFASPSSDITEGYFGDPGILANGVIGIDSNTWFKPDELDGKKNTFSYGAAVTDVDGFGHSIKKLDKTVDGQELTYYFIRNPKSGGNHTVIFFKKDTLSGEDVKFLLNSLEFKESKL